MKLENFVTILVLVLFTCNSQVASLQTLDDFQSWVRMISISDDNEILVACGDDDSVHIYKKNAGNLYSLNYSLSDFSHVNVAQITGDGKWLLVIDEDSATGNVFSQNSIGRFELYQNISTSGDQIYAFGGAISQDHRMVILGMWSGAIYFYELNSQTQQYELSYTKSNPFSQISSIELSQDTSQLIVCTYGYFVSVYSRTGEEQFETNQIFLLSEYTFKISSLTGDHEYLTIAGQNGQKVSLYKFNGSKYEELSTLIFYNNSRFASISEDKKWFVVSQKYQLLIYLFNGGDLELYDEITTGWSNYNLISKDMYYLFNAHYQQFDVYELDPQFCENCMQNQSLQCGTYQVCDECNNYEKQKHQNCLNCNQTGCLYCNSTDICIQCDESDDYFFNQSIRACAKCSIEHCLDCNNLTHCVECLQSYHLNEGTGKCEECSLQGCYLCETLDTCYHHSCQQPKYQYNSGTKICDLICVSSCMECQQQFQCSECTIGFHKINNYCLNSSLIVNGFHHYNYLCSIGGCVSCMQSSSQCRECASGFYILKGNCYPCPQDNCQVCSSSFPNCLSCFAGYYLSYSHECESCEDNCLECESSQCLRCANGYYVSGKVCLECSDNCDHCQSVSECQKCTVGFTLSSSGRCVQCTSGCTSCERDNLGECIFPCSQGFYEQSGQCQRCSDGCSSCSSSICNECFYGYQLSHNICSRICKFPCLKCSQTNNEKCQSCYQGYRLIDSTCVEDLSCNSSRNCQFCPQTYRLSDNTCISCQIKNCAFCLPNQNSIITCTLCQGGYILKNNKCQSCAEGCQSCVSDGICSTCKSGYYMMIDNNEQVTGKCSKCDQYFFCKQCERYSNQCTSCQDGFQLLGFKCISKKRVTFTIVLNVEVSLFSSLIEEVVSNFLTLMGSNFNKKEYITLTKIKKGSTIVQGIITVPEGQDISEPYTNIKCSLSQGNTLGGFEILSVQVGMQGQQAPIALCFLEKALIVGSMIILFIVLIGIFIYCKKKRHYISNINEKKNIEEDTGEAESDFKIET